MHKNISYIAPATSQMSDSYYRNISTSGLCAQRCGACGSWHHIPREICSNCGSFDLDWASCAGRGSLFSWTVTITPPLSSLSHDTPFVVGLVELDEGVRLVSRIVGVEEGDLRVGLELRVRLVELRDDFSLPVFEPVGGEPGWVPR